MLLRGLSSMTRSRGPSSIQQRIVLLTLTIPIVCASRLAAAQELATFEHHVVGARLLVEPSELFVPKNIPGSLLVRIATSEGAMRTELARLGHGAHVEGVLRGPAFPAYRLLGLPNEALQL